MKTPTSIKIDPKTKKEASKLAEELGLSLSAVVNVSLKAFVREGHISFSKEPQLNTQTKKELLAALKDGNTVGPFDSIADLKKALGD